MDEPPNLDGLSDSESIANGIDYEIDDRCKTCNRSHGIDEGNKNQSRNRRLDFYDYPNLDDLSESESCGNLVLSDRSQKVSKVSAEVKKTKHHLTKRKQELLDARIKTIPEKVTKLEFTQTSELSIPNQKVTKSDKEQVVNKNNQVTETQLETKLQTTAAEEPPVIFEVMKNPAISVKSVDTGESIKVKKVDSFGTKRVSKFEEMRQKSSSGYNGVSTAFLENLTTPISTNASKEAAETAKKNPVGKGWEISLETRESEPIVKYGKITDKKKRLSLEKSSRDLEKMNNDGLIDKPETWENVQNSEKLASEPGKNSTGYAHRLATLASISASKEAAEAKRKKEKHSIFAKEKEKSLKEFEGDPNSKNGKNMARQEQIPAKKNSRELEMMRNDKSMDITKMPKINGRRENLAPKPDSFSAPSTQRLAELALINAKKQALKKITKETDNKPDRELAKFPGSETEIELFEATKSNPVIEKRKMMARIERLSIEKRPQEPKTSMEDGSIYMNIVPESEIKLAPGIDKFSTAFEEKSATIESINAKEKAAEAVKIAENKLMETNENVSTSKESEEEYLKEPESEQIIESRKVGARLERLSLEKKARESSGTTEGSKDLSLISDGSGLTIRPHLALEQPNEIRSELLKEKLGRRTLHDTRRRSAGNRLLTEFNRLRNELREQYHSDCEELNALQQIIPLTDTLDSIATMVFKCAKVAQKVDGTSDIKVEHINFGLSMHRRHEKANDEQSLQQKYTSFKCEKHP